MSYTKLEIIKKQIYEDGNIDESELAHLCQIVEKEGETIQESTARVLLQLNTILRGIEQPEAFYDLVVDSVSRYLVSLDQADGQDAFAWVHAHMMIDNYIDPTEQRILSRCGIYM